MKKLLGNVFSFFLAFFLFALEIWKKKLHLVVFWLYPIDLRISLQFYFLSFVLYLSNLKIVFTIRESFPSLFKFHIYPKVFNFTIQMIFNFTAYSSVVFSFVVIDDILGNCN